jgi:hypothetical protein
MQDMDSYTFAEAEQLTGTSRKALRNRVYRGQVESVLRDGVRRIPRSELERAGLLRNDGETGEIDEMPREASHETPMIGEVLDRLEAQAGELAELRLISRQAESVRDAHTRMETAFHRASAEKQVAEQQLEQFRNASWRERRRLLRELRTERAT